MKAEEFTQDPEVLRNIVFLKARWRQSVSDVLDAAGNQYVDLVMEGGGVLGISLLGYTYALEQAGIRFLGIGGTSAGAITALLLAAYDDRDKPKSGELAACLANQNLYEFVDGDDDARDFIRALLKEAGPFKLGLTAVQVIDNFREDLGLNPGDKFRQWLTGILTKRKIRTTRDLNQRMAYVPKGGYRFRDREEGDVTGKLALVAAEVTTETKVDFPRMSPLFWERPDEVDPALFVRASMSVPFFFHPFRIEGVPQTPEVKQRWKEMASYDGELPRTAMFMDGGIMSNFPINIFHQTKRVPLSPTFGVKIGTDRRVPQAIEGPMALAGAVFNSARHALDYDFITNNPDYRHLVACIDTGEHHWLNFELTDADKIDLFRRGVREAVRFLQSFDWEKYKEVRRHLMEANKRPPVVTPRSQGGDGELDRVEPLPPVPLGGKVKTRKP